MDDHQKLIAPQATQSRFLTEFGGDAISQNTQHLIAHVVAVDVVDQFEAVKIQEQQRRLKRFVDE